jgi:hypothetical protein
LDSQDRTAKQDGLGWIVMKGHLGRDRWDRIGRKGWTEYDSKDRRRRQEILDRTAKKGHPGQDGRTGWSR